MESFLGLSLLHVVLPPFLMAIAVAIVRAQGLLTATILLSIYSLLMALMYLALGAPDVAITEAAIGAGIGTLLLLGALLLTGENEKTTPFKPVHLIAVIAVGLLMAYGMGGLPAFGDPAAAPNLHVAPYYIENAETETGVPELVTAVLASYRGFDTLGEVFVIFTAGISVLALLGGKKVSS